MTESIAQALAAMREAVEAFNELVRLASIGSFPNGQPQAAAAAMSKRLRWEEIDRQVQGQIADRRVLVVGVEVSDEAAAFVRRGASEVLACAQPRADQQRQRAELDAPAGVDLRWLAWRQLNPARHGAYDVVHCNGLLHRVAEPIALLRKLRAMSAPNATLLIGSMILDDPERSEYLRLVPDGYAGDPTWWFLPGRLAFRWLVRAAGFEVQAEFGEQEGPRDLLPVVAAYLKATAST